MAELILGAAVSAGASALFPTVAWAGSLGWTIGSALGAALFPRGPDMEGPRISDLRVQVSTLGSPIPMLRGSMRVAGCVIWSSGIRETKHETSQGKGDPPTYTSYTYDVDVAVGVCEGAITGIRKIWANGQLIYNRSETADAVTVAVSAENVTVYTGSATQLPDPTMEAAEGAGNVPGYRGLAYVVMKQFDLTNFGIPNFTFEVVQSGVLDYQLDLLVDSTPAGPTTGYEAVRCGKDYTDYYYFGVIPDNSVTRERYYHSGGSEVTTWSALLEGRITNTNAYSGFTDVSGFVTGWDDITGAGAYFCFVNGDAGTLTRFLVTPASPTPAWCRDDNKIFTHDSDGYILAFDISGGGIEALQVAESATSYTYITAIGASDSYVFVMNGDNSTNNDITVLNRSDLSFVETWNVSLTANTTSRAQIQAVTDELLYVFTGGSSGTHLWEVLDGAVTASYAQDLPYATTGPSSYKRSEDSFIWGGAATNLWIGTFTERLTSPGVTVGSIVSDLCLKAGLEAADIDVTQLTDVCHGYTVPRPMAARAAIEPLQKAFFFDAVESDDKIKFVVRGGVAVASVPFEELGASLGSDFTEPLTTVRKQELELPQRVTVVYPDKLDDYQQGAQKAQRLIARTVGQANEELAIAMTPDFAAQVADILLYMAWRERLLYKMQTWYKWALLEPTDVVEVTAATGDVYTLRLVRKDETNGLLKFDAVAEDPDGYTSTAVGQGNTASEEVRGVIMTRAEYMDTPPLRDQDNGAYWYLAACGFASGWDGAVVHVSADGGATWNDAATVMTAGTIGYTATALSANTPGGGNVFDEHSTLTVTLYNGTLSSVTELAALNGANAALIGDELVIFKTAALVSGSTYSLSGFLRGRVGTEWATGTHVAGERFVLLTSSQVTRVSTALVDVNAAKLYRAATFGQNPLDAVQASFTWTGRSLKPLSPAHLSAIPQPNGDLYVTWVRRARVNGQWLDMIDVPLDETTEAYDLEFLDGTTVKKTLIDTTPPYLYTASALLADFGGYPSTVNVNVYQKSASVGRGFPASASVATANVTTLLLHMNGTDASTSFPDASVYAHAVTAYGNAQVDTAQYKFGGASGLFDGTGDYLRVADHSVFDLGSGDFTIECWVKTTGANSYATLISRPTNTGFTAGAWTLEYNPGSANGRLVLYVADYSTGSPLITATSGDVHDGSWHHVAWIRNGSSHYLTLDGAVVGSATWAGAITNIAADVWLGYEKNYAGRDYNGWLDEVRISSVARWTSFPFTPPVAEYSA